mmetsp:Transcript_21824/g.55717  ORF Transcript_21824/g.55717 Transcript_21824/m.55717 type:complete len:213 (+) Transcript_21824:96-734(+)
MGALSAGQRCSKPLQQREPLWTPALDVLPRRPRVLCGCRRHPLQHPAMGSSAHRGDAASSHGGSAAAAASHRRERARRHAGHAAAARAHTLPRATSGRGCERAEGELASDIRAAPGEASGAAAATGVPAPVGDVPHSLGGRHAGRNSARRPRPPGGRRDAERQPQPRHIGASGGARPSVAGGGRGGRCRASHKAGGDFECSTRGASPQAQTL